MTRTALLLVLTLGLTSCSKRASAPQPAPPDRPASAVQAHGDSGAMHERLVALTGARDRLVAGDLDGARAGLQRVVEDAVPSMAPEAWRPHVEDLRDATASGAESDTIADLSKAVAEGARACGACHRQVGGGPSWVKQDLPAPEDAMGRHVWAADRMWEGLIGPAPDRWRSAAQTLTDEVDHDGALFAGLDLKTAAAASRLHDRVHTLGAAGQRDELSDEDRAGLYGTFIAACAECHELTGGGPR